MMTPRSLSISAGSLGSVDVPAELGADGTEVVQDAFLREMLRAVEAHVLQEVRETVLVRFFLDGADVRGKVELRPLGREFIVADVIGKSVVQVSDADGRIVGEGGHGLLHGLFLALRGGRECGQERQKGGNDQKSFHKKEYISLQR